MPIFLKSAASGSSPDCPEPPAIAPNNPYIIFSASFIASASGILASPGLYPIPPIPMPAIILANYSSSMSSSSSPSSMFSS
jgi:hypothetical protein